VTSPHHLATTRRDAAIHQKPIEGNALIAQWIALVDADDRWRQTFDILATGEAGLTLIVLGDMSGRGLKAAIKVSLIVGAPKVSLGRLLRARGRL
jgi:hypothetical protein